MLGSSPLARGALAGGGEVGGGGRLIPARAGSTRRPCAMRRGGPAHPRSRGEHENSTNVAKAGYGLIPARAGSTGPTGPCGSTERAHPRSRGEHLAMRRVMRSTCGSSPLARGARPRHGGYRRVRWGSSPLARGAHHRQVPGRGVRRLIPARAGSTGPQPRRPPLRRAHPRSRGEHYLWPGGARAVLGSSPLARGARGRGAAARGVHGLIPARAGSTRWSRASGARWGAHPRSRGEHATMDAESAAEQGSSPLARGAHPVR